MSEPEDVETLARRPSLVPTTTQRPTWTVSGRAALLKPPAPVGVLAEEAQAAAHEELRGVVRGVHDARGDAREASEEGRMERLDLSRRLVASRRCFG